MFVIEEELKKLPDQPGVYIMHDSRDAIIYIGKAVSLRKRVHQYFQPSHDEGIKKAQMVKQIARFEYIVTDSELEALVLECNLIKEHRPKYNTMLRDDKTYPYIRVTLGEDFPRVLFSRQQKKDKSRYFGPYTSAGAVKDTIELVNKIYQLRTCNRNLPRDTGKDRPCLNYHIHQCTAPCQGYITKEAYRERVDAVVEFLNGHPQVERVNHPSLPSHPDHALYQKFFPNGGASVFTFDIKGGAEAAYKFIDNLQVFSLLANVADVKSLVIHPATTTHSQLSPEELADQEIRPNTIRLSIGTEHIEDILEDLQMGFHAAEQMGLDAAGAEMPEKMEERS